MLISQKLADAINEQIGHEFGAHLQYLAIAAHFRESKLTLLEKLFFAQAAEETGHALKFVRYLLDTQAPLKIPAVAAPKSSFPTAEAAVAGALEWEKEVTRQVTRLMEIAVGDSDYLSQGFLQWFIDEQLEEINKMDRLLEVIRRSGEKNLLMVEAYLAHLES